MLQSTRKLLGKRGWRLDRAAHNHLYFVYYHPYVRTLYHLFRIPAARLAWMRPIRIIIGMAFDRYHAKFLSGSDARKILTLNEDLRTWVERLGKKYNAGKIFQEEALSIVERFRGMGYVTQAFFKVATGGSTGAVCNCHPDTCVSLKATGSPCRFDPGLSMAADAGYGASRIAAKCRLCGGCAKVCRFGAIRNPRNLVEIADSGKRKDL